MPTPPLPGYSRLWASTIALLVLATIMAVLLARRRRSHVPVAVLLGVDALADMVRASLHAWVPGLAGPAPYQGAVRAAYHVEQALYLLWPALLAWASLRVLAGRRWGIRIGCVWGALMLLIIACYPALRGEGLRQVYLLATMVGLFVSLASAGVYLRDRARPLSVGELIVVALVAVELVSLLLGPWSRGLYGDAYQLEQVALALASCSSTSSRRTCSSSANRVPGSASAGTARA